MRTLQNHIGYVGSSFMATGFQMRMNGAPYKTAFDSVLS